MPDKDKDTPSPEETANNGGDEQAQGAHPYPAGFLYGYPHDPTGSGEGSAPTAAFFPFQSALYPYPAPNGMFPMNMSQLAQAGVFMPRPKRRQVKNACVNCATACKRCDNNRPCDRCTKYGIGDSCTDSARKERKKGVKRGPYKRRLKNGQSIDNGNDEVNTDSEWLPNGGEGAQPTTVDPANLPNHPPGGYVPPEGFYTYPYPYPFPPSTNGEGSDGAFPPPPHFFPHLHPAAYPPYPPWGQPPAAFDVSSNSTGGDGGSARTNAKKKKVKKGEKEKSKKSKNNKDPTAVVPVGGTGSDLENVLDIADVTDPSLLDDHHHVNGDVDELGISDD